MNPSRNASRYSLLVFDWDGTLMDSTAVIARSIQAACRDLGVAEPSDADARYVIGLGLADALRRAVPSLPPERHAELAQAYRRHYFAQDDQTVLFAGVVDMLDALRAAGFELAVATGKSRPGLDRALAHVGLRSMFAATRTADETASKPHPQMLHELMDELGHAPECTVMVGDTTHDLQMALNAGTDAAAVAWGAHPREALEALRPVTLAASMAELRRFLLGAANTDAPQ